MTAPTHSVRHDTFVLERSYPAAVARVWAAFADPEAKAAWFGAPDAATTERTVDFRVGGREVSEAVLDGTSHRFESRYFEIVERSRIVYAYDLYVAGVKLSTSLTTIELHDEGSGTRLVFTEHGAFYDGHEEPGLRREGTEQLLGTLGAALAA
ncbi:SRPBCC family protein [Isoptericola sp. b441]|uniref:SRPBCC family protein n=1 Tax=Actinotalea lenta TaxID=3064654 RepID=A0ABT9D9I4_9CELL|nr:MULTISPECIES: SRPBCC family protein [unclassified Isoptericola]MDO8107569.1 SRPBCC family protein [Isoptericola sp. b441]MDO8120771.1 SRPBCC family protein [Isoptericola sp. b490]